MAHSLVCKDCNTLLKDIQAAQDHSEVTGHVNFEESVEVIRQLACTACGKRCRTDAERDLHIKYTGHTEFEDKTGEAGVIDSEAQIRAARQQAASMDVDDDEAGVSGMQAEGDKESAELVPAVVDEKLLQEMQDMGFPLNRATRALHFSGNNNIEAAVAWVCEHESDVDIDEPLLVEAPNAKESKEKLTPEEAKRRAEELVRKAKEKREREEREAEAVRERERIRAGKELLLAKRKEEEAAMKRNAELRQREKEEERRAREALKKQLEEDRKERRRKLGLPEELTEEEKAKEAEKQAKEVQEMEKRKAVPVKPISAIHKARDKLVSIKKAHPGEDDKFKTCCTTMGKYLSNILQNPVEEKFRSIKLSNAAFQSRVASVAGSVEFLELCGFKNDGEVLTMAKDDVNDELLRSACGELTNALTNPFFGVL